MLTACGHKLTGLSCPQLLHVGLGSGSSPHNIALLLCGALSSSTLDCAESTAQSGSQKPGFELWFPCCVLSNSGANDC